MGSGGKSRSLEDAFPGLSTGSYAIKSPETNRYNCFAWAAGENDRWWDPGEQPYSFWPDDATESLDIDTIVEAYTTVGYERCSDGDLEKGFEKVALFTGDSGVPTHAARQLTDGRWTSKLGRCEDIEHDLEGLEGDLYGKISCFLKR